MAFLRPGTDCEIQYLPDGTWLVLAGDVPSGDVTTLDVDVQAGGTTAALTGTCITDGVLESEIVTGNETIIITLTDDTWAAAGTGPIGSTADTQALIDGIDGDVAGGTGWDAEVKANLVPADDVVRDSPTQCTITTNAAAGYAISSDETVTVTIPAVVLVTSADPVEATPVITITNESDGVAIPIFTHHYTKNIGA